MRRQSRRGLRLTKFTLDNCMANNQITFFFPLFSSEEENNSIAEAVVS